MHPCLPRYVPHHCNQHWSGRAPCNHKHSGDNHHVRLLLRWALARRINVRLILLVIATLFTLIFWGSQSVPAPVGTIPSHAPTFSPTISSPPPEFVVVDGVKYKVPAPWRGAKLVHVDSNFNDISLIPVIYTENNSKIYLRKPARDAAVKMLQAAAAEKVLLLIRSGYRSIRYQRILWSKRLSQGKTFQEIAKSVAPPGYSEHHLGTAVDLVSDTKEFKRSSGYKWLLNNAHQYCFFESYPKDNSTTGVYWEPWHWKYVPC